MRNGFDYFHTCDPDHAVRLRSPDFDERICCIVPEIPRNTTGRLLQFPTEAVHCRHAKTTSHPVTVVAASAPSLAVWAGMIAWPDTALGKTVFTLCKVWILALPAVWFFGIERQRISMRRPGVSGIVVGAALGLAISAMIFAGYWTFGRTWIDPAVVKGLVAKVGLAAPPSIWPGRLLGPRQRPAGGICLAVVVFASSDLPARDGGRRGLGDWIHPPPHRRHADLLSPPRYGHRRNRYLHRRRHLVVGAAGGSAPSGPAMSATPSSMSPSSPSATTFCSDNPASNPTHVSMDFHFP